MSGKFEMPFSKSCFKDMTWPLILNPPKPGTLDSTFHFLFNYPYITCLARIKLNTLVESPRCKRLCVLPSIRGTGGSKLWLMVATLGFRV